MRIGFQVTTGHVEVLEVLADVDLRHRACCVDSPQYIQDRSAVTGPAKFRGHKHGLFGSQTALTAIVCDFQTWIFQICRQLGEVFYDVGTRLVKLAIRWPAEGFCLVYAWQAPRGRRYARHRRRSPITDGIPNPASIFATQFESGFFGPATLVNHLFYFGQDQRQKDEHAVRAAVKATTRWVLGKKWQHVILEIDNEVNSPKYDHEILKPRRVHELIQHAKDIEVDGRRLLVGTSFGGGGVPTKNVIEHSDFLLIHGNGVSGGDAMRKFIGSVKAARGNKKMPIIINEDDHFDFAKPDNNMTAAVMEHVSWGYFDFRRQDATKAYDEGYQSMPVNWGISSQRKKGFFELLKRITGNGSP